MTKQDNQDSQNSSQSRDAEIPEVQNELSKVATNPKQSIIILLVISVIFVVIFFKLFLSDKKTAEVAPVIAPSDISKPVQDNIKNIPEIPKLPVVPKLEAPAELPLPPPPPLPTPKIDIPKIALPAATTKDNNVIEAPLPPMIASSASGKLVESDEEKKRREAKRKSTIVLVAGVENQKTASQIAEENTFRERGDMTFVLARGKIIEAVLESAISSDFGGKVSAIISRDVYSERGRTLLIPKGSKVFGEYSTGTDGAYGRIAIIWNYIDLSNGYTINLDAISVDNLGRKGQQGRVDNKIKERLANSILMSAFNIGIAKGLDKLVTPPINSQAVAANTAVANNIQNIAQSIFTGPGTEDEKINNICAQVQNAITDKTSGAYTSIIQACNTARTTTGALAGQRLAALMSSVTSAAISLLAGTATAITPTQAQNASKQAFIDITNTVKDMVNQQEFKRTITIDQGTVIKIYVNKDYKFPLSVLKKSRLVK